MGLGKLHLIGKSQVCPKLLGCGGLASMWDTYRLLCEYEDAPKMPAGLMYLFKELHITITLWQKEKRITFTVGWPLLWAVWLATLPSFGARRPDKRAG